jgi:alanine racemase
MTYAASAVINLAALKHNLARVHALAPHSKIIAVIKANAYGHGLLRVAHGLKEVDMFAVAHCEEAAQLRDAGIKKPILVLQGFMDKSECEWMSANNIESVIHSAYQVHVLEKLRLAQAINVWIKIDTGMHRLGLDIKDLQHAFDVCLTSDAVHTMRCMTHFHSADDTESDATKDQLYQFLDNTNHLRLEQSAANSAALISDPMYQLDWVRPGIMLYGIAPFADKTGKDLELKPVMNLESRLIAVNKLNKGDTVGYGATWKAQQATNIGVVAIGYGDGYPRHATNGTPVWINGRTVPLVGRVSMDMITVDLGATTKDSISDRVVLWGEELPVETVAQHADTIPYELVSKVTSRVTMISKN